MKILTQNHQPRLNDAQAAPAVLPAMLALQQVTNRCGLELPLMELVKLRASQINGCAFCFDMHYRDAKKSGETDERLYLLNAWREAGVYSSREQAALAWTKAANQTEQWTSVRRGFCPGQLRIQRGRVT